MRASIIILSAQGPVFSHTRITAIAVTVAHAVTRTRLCTHKQGKHAFLPRKVQVCPLHKHTHTCVMASTHLRPHTHSHQKHTHPPLAKPCLALLPQQRAVYTVCYSVCYSVCSADAVWCRRFVAERSGPV